MLSPRAARWIVWLIAGLYVVLASVGFALQVSAGRTFFMFSVPLLAAISVEVLIWVIVGAIIVTRHPRHPVGWILSLATIAWGLDSFTYGYVAVAASTPSGDLPGVHAALIWLTWTGFPFSMFGLGLLFLLFPDGQPPSPRWGKLRWSMLAGLIAYLGVAPLGPRNLTADASLTSPLAVAESARPVFEAAFGAASIVLLASLLAAAVSLILRLRHARPIERQQVKWFVYAAAFVPLPAILIGVEDAVGLASERLLDVVVIAHLVSLAGVAVAVAISIFRYRLYDIDLIINRSLVYGALTLTLAAIYFTSVAVFQNLIGLAVDQQSPIAIVASTLVVAALFHPLRRRLQQFIDRRFYRARYDAARMLERFASSLSEAVEVEAQMNMLLEVVDEAVQPAHVSLWTRS